MSAFHWEARIRQGLSDRQAAQKKNHAASGGPPTAHRFQAKNIQSVADAVSKDYSIPNKWLLNRSIVKLANEFKLMNAEEEPPEDNKGNGKVEKTSRSPKRQNKTNRYTSVDYLQQY